MRNNIFCRLCCLCLFLNVSIFSFSQFEEGIEGVTLSPIIGNAINNGAKSTVGYKSYGEVSRKIKNIVSFRIDESDTLLYFASGFSATVNFSLETKVMPAGSWISAPKSLTVGYDTTRGSKYNVRAYIVLPAEYDSVRVTVTGLTITGQSGWNPKPILILENEIRVLRYYTLTTNPALLNPTSNQKVGLEDALKVKWSWDSLTRNNMSQIEWAWMATQTRGHYVEGGSFRLDALFNNNSTRVDLDRGQDSLKIPLLYGDTGKIFYRLRAAYRKNDGTVITGPWSAVDSFAFNGHQSNLNWQAATSFAENGKSKTVIQYFDGSLRNRQVVTKDNSTGNTIVGETIYDLQGRPNVQILPTPTIDTVIKFFNDFNRFQGQGINDDPARYFDLTPAALVCNPAPRLDSNYGNGRYYSSNNPWLATESKSKAIPNAFGYAYTETRFMDDATERVRSQGGVGAAHQIGSGHETKYYYGKPTQPELDALFGTEVGDASHYSKNMVRDANGQMSVMYVDMHGRTVATALAGHATPGIDSLLANPADYPMPTGQLINQLITPATNMVVGNTVESVSTLLLPSNTKCDFTYKLDPAILSMMNCNSQQVCFDCKYDLEISIKSEDCGDTTPIIKRYKNLQIVPAGQACTTSMGFVGDGVSTATKQIDFSLILGPGSWVIRKTLSMNDSMFNIRKDSALKAFLCRSQDSIYQTVYATLYSTSGCGTTTSTASCESCLLDLGTYTTYRVKFLAAIGNPPNFNESEIRNQYTQDSLGCVQACGLSPQLSTLGSLRSQMLSHMIPFSGQYAVENIVNNAGIPDPNRLEGKFNIFTNSYYYNGSTLGKPYYYRTPVTEANQTSSYFTEDNDVDVTIHPPGNPGYLGSISKQDFAGLFQTSWAKSLIYYHPEWKKLNIAETTLKTSYEWLDKVLACNTYDAAVAIGAHNPMSYDPYFVNNYVPQDVTDMQRYLTNYIGTQSSNPSIWRLANGVTLCAGLPENQKMTCINLKSKTGMDAGANTAELRNKIWQQFKTMYLTYRNEMVIKYINSRPGVLSQADMNLLQSEGKQLVFVTMQGIANQNGWSGWWNNVSTGDTTGTGVYLGNNAGNIDNCVAQKPFWRARLLQCEHLVNLLNTETPGDSTTVNTIINSILNGLVSVCNNSRDTQHPFGASNVKPGYAGTPQNFEAVINQVFSSNGITTPPNFFCNPFSIDFPKPYGKNPPVVTNISNQVDSCACNRFRTLKVEAKSKGFDTLSRASMNQFLTTNYNDSVSLVLWNGLQNCNQLSVDSCWWVYGAADNCTLRQASDSSRAKGALSRRPPPGDLCPLGSPVIFYAQYVNTGTYNNIQIDYYDIETSSYECNIEVRNQFGVLIQVVPVSCGNGMPMTAWLSLPACQTYSFTVVNYTFSCGTYYSEPYYVYPLPSCTACPEPVINSVTVNSPPPSTWQQNMTVNYTIPSGAYNCKLKVYSYNCNMLIPVDSFALNCWSNTKTVTLGSCLKYRFVVTANISQIASYCDSIAVSDTVRIDSCWRQTCQKVYSPVQLSEFTTIPSFLNCGYQKPCITCGKLDSLTAEFRQLYPSYNGVPYLDSAATSSQAQQNSLWARFLNYRTGFSLSAIDYMVAYNKCHTQVPVPALAICSFTKPLNDPADIYPADTIPCKNVQTQAQFVASILYEKTKDSLIARFDSLYRAKCITAQTNEVFYVRYKPREYHYTLYYYDRAGNLVKTLPPAAVKPNYDSVFLLNVRNGRISGSELVNPLNNVLLSTQYRYNSLNQIVIEKSPDKGLRRSWYDRLGRLVVSQNAKQSGMGTYSYTIYDQLGRVSEVGEKSHPSPMTQGTSKDTTALAAWFTSGGLRREIVRTVYDESYTPLQTVVAGFSGLFQSNLRNRISYTYLKNVENQADSWNTATFFSYDVFGNIDTLLQDYKTGMGSVGCSNDPLVKSNRFKKIVYQHDLISGMINQVVYQPFNQDQFVHRYRYDGENKLIEVMTSKDKIYWEKDAVYEGYRHGPLSRTSLGQNRVQGVDFAYTIQGWLKGINSSDFQSGSNQTNFDIGKDGENIGLNRNRHTGRDAYGFSLLYFHDDYRPIHTSSTPFVNIPASLPSEVSGISTGANVYNGSIRGIVMKMPQLGDSKLYGYRYDQLNRYVRMDAFNGVYSVGNSASLTRVNDYHEEITYDPNGNIRTYLRNATTQNGGMQAMDNLTFQYERAATGQLFTNRLRYVHDQVSASNYPNANEPTWDIDNQTSLSYGQVVTDNNISQIGDNYQYDSTGNLIKNIRDSISQIEWTVYGQIKSVTKTSGIVINYTYDAFNFRVSKIVSSNGVDRATYYIRDANGQVLSVYTRQSNSTSTLDPLHQSEVHLYGAKRLGIYASNVDVQSCQPDGELRYFIRGNKSYELSNHLGNVLVTISDKKIGVDILNDGVIDYFSPEVLTAIDNYPYGMIMPGRNFNLPGAEYRYGFNGKENDNEIEGQGNGIDFGARVVDPRIGRFFSVDPIAKAYTSQTPYAFAGNNPILFVDVEGNGPDLPPGYVMLALLKNHPVSSVALLLSNNTSPNQLYKWVTKQSTDPSAYYKLKGAFGEAEAYKRLMTDFYIGAQGIGVPQIRTYMGAYHNGMQVDVQTTASSYTTGRGFFRVRHSVAVRNYDFDGSENSLEVYGRWRNATYTINYEVKTLSPGNEAGYSFRRLAEGIEQTIARSKGRRTIGVLVTDKQTWLNVANDPVYGPQLKALYEKLISNKDAYLRLEDNLNKDAHSELMSAYKTVQDAVNQKEKEDAEKAKEQAKPKKKK